MAVQTKAPPQARRFGLGRALTVIAGIVCFGLLGYLLLQIVTQFVVPPPARRLILVQDVPLPSGLPTPAQEKLLVPNAAQNTLLNPGVTVDFDTIGENGPANEGTVTIRERDSMKQQRIGLGEIKSFLIEKIS